MFDISELEKEAEERRDEQLPQLNFLKIGLFNSRGNFSFARVLPSKNRSDGDGSAPSCVSIGVWSLDAGAASAGSSTVMTVPSPSALRTFIVPL